MLSLYIMSPRRGNLGDAFLLWLLVLARRFENTQGSL